MERDLSTSVIGEPAPVIEGQSAVSWGAVFAGATAGLALSFVLVALAAGFGLKLASPWPGDPGDHSGFSPMLGASMIVVQVLAGGLGGYLAGRLRTKWTNVHGHEVHFRDTAHGLLSWAASTLMGIVLAATVLAPVAGRIASAAVDPAAFSIEAPGTATSAVTVAPVDPTALRQLAQREANIRAQFSLFMGIGLLLGAFTSCVAAAIGGLRREEMHTLFLTERPGVARPAAL